MPVSLTIPSTKEMTVQQGAAAAAINTLIIQGMKPEVVREMQLYAQKLHRNSPKMKPARIQRMVSKKFKVNLV